MNYYFNCTLALLALINPISKIFVINSFPESSLTKRLSIIVIRASFIAGIILVTFALTGNSLLKSIFHVDIYSFQIVGGFVLLFRGFQALNKGLFFETELSQKLEDASIVPLASPMIAGPATITAAMTFPSHYGMDVTIIAIIAGVMINLGFMLSAKKISNVLIRFNMMGALIRITGLIVATIGAQMMLDGLREFIATV